MSGWKKYLKKSQMESLRASDLQQVRERGQHLRRPDVQPFLSAGRLLTVRHVTQVQDGRQDGEYPTRNNKPNLSDTSPQTHASAQSDGRLTVVWWPAGSRPSPSPAAGARSRVGGHPHLLSWSFPESEERKSVVIPGLQVERRWRAPSERSPVWGRSILRAAGVWTLAARPPTRPPADSKTRDSSCVKRKPQSSVQLETVVRRTIKVNNNQSVT